MGEVASSILEKISSYNLFNFLFTGAIFLVGSDVIAGTQFLSGPVAVFILIAYFLGMVLSCVGSLIIEPILKKIGFVKFANYADFLKAEKSDGKILVLLEMTNTYRTLMSVFLALAGVKIGVAMKDKYPALIPYVEWLWPFLTAALFAFAYRKQSKFIHDRVQHHKHDQNRPASGENKNG